MPAGRLSTAEDVEDFVRGCTFFGTGGGGFPESGTATLLRELESGKQIAWVDAEDIPDDASAASAFLNGNPSPPSPQETTELDSIGLTSPVHEEREMLLKALRVLGEFTGKEVSILVPPELGAANGPAALALGAYRKIPVVDGDYAGRSVPEIRNTTFCAGGHRPWPLSCVDRFGNVTIVGNAAGSACLEKLARSLSDLTFGLAGQAALLISGREMKRTIIPGTLTMCLSLGRLIRESRTYREDIPRMIATYLEGWLLFEGTVSRKAEERKGGGLSGTVHVANNGHELSLWYRSGTHLALLDGKVAAMSPDLVSVVRVKTGEPTIHARLRPGDEVAVIGTRSHERLRTPEGVASLGPRRWGFGFDFVPIEKLAKQQRG